MADADHGDKASYFADFTTQAKKGDSTVVGTVMDILLWKDPKWSGIALLVGLLWFFLTTLGGYTVLALASVFIMLNLIVSIIASLVSAWYGEGLPDKKAPQVEIEAVKQAVGTAVEAVNGFIKWYANVLKGGNMMGALQVVGGLLLTYVIGNWFSAYVLLFIAFLGAFCGPVGYSKNKALVDAQVAKIKGQLDKTIDKMSTPAKDKKKE
eukprot:CAMPEP_0206230634 /NCGR_PEP_ID=MMETSP0047_2-20121206/10376_1 /ASSEMBLY_ACC=CAM_ASM_000192 /TAXON_ID=195065 /ORGANISM="Chroomonas mesostigmatica_cf, Strain CCMP1168" /LENGTH=208 /DNA_ID=CAMNT_0053654095 /DNA_START=22 /DNA_END=648 /DNA_ORIENTATION=+